MRIHEEKEGCKATSKGTSIHIIKFSLDHTLKRDCVYMFGIVHIHTARTVHFEGGLAGQVRETRGKDTTTTTTRSWTYSKF